MTGKILAVDDEAFNLDILNEYLSDAGYEVVLARDGAEALSALEAHRDVEAIVLDRMMPRMDGMACLRQVKADPATRDLPVVMQTAASSPDQIREGIEAGVFYYLTKPYQEAVLLSVVGAALAQGRQQAMLREEVSGQRQVLGLMQRGEFRFRTLEDAQALAVFISNCFPEPERVVYGLNELLVNAVEHGNLGINYAEKGQLVLEGRWRAEIEHRLGLAAFADRHATLRLEADQTSVAVTITDTGTGFDHKRYMDLDSARATDPHGRGIATARLMSFDTLSFQGSGNIVTCSVRLPPN